VSEEIEPDVKLELHKGKSPSLFAHKLVGVQPMEKPSESIFGMRYVYADQEQRDMNKEIAGKLDELGFGDEITDEILNDDSEVNYD
jgi:hypothetical protein